MKRAELYHKVQKLIDSIEDLLGKIEGNIGYDESWRLKFKDEGIENFYYCLKEAEEDLEKATEYIGKTLTKEERIYEPSELRTIKVYEKSVSSKENALAYLTKNITKAIDADWGTEIGKLFGIEPKIHDYKGKKLVFVAELLKQVEPILKESPSMDC